MQLDTSLPADFDGIFRFTNWTDEDFVGQWGGKTYTFPKHTTAPMVIADESPLGHQNIRKHFAKKLAEREFFKSEKYKQLTATERNPDGSPRLNSFHMGNTYDESVLKEYIQKCLEPLPVSKHIVAEAPKDNLEEKLSKDEEGRIVTKPVGKGKSIKDLARDFES